MRAERDAATRVQFRPSRTRGTIRTAGLILMAGAVSSLTAGCDGGPDFANHVEVTNDCGADIAVRLADAPSPTPVDETVGEAVVVHEGQPAVALVSASASSVYLWVAVPGDSSWGAATEFHVADLPDVDAGEGQTAKSLVIQGDMCPS